MADLIKPKALKKGDTIGVFAPGGVIYDYHIEDARTYWENAGFNLHIEPQTLYKDDQFAGTPEQKIEAMHKLFSDPKIDAVLCARGGNGCIHILDRIDYDLIAKNPKLFIGFSDVTLIHHAINKKAGLQTIHAPMLKEYRKECNDQNKDVALDFLMGNTTENLFRTEKVDIVSQGKATGSLFGGNMSLLRTLMMTGDKYLPDLSGAILVLEDWNEELSRIDLFLGGLKVAGVFEKVAGVVVGISPTLDTGVNPFGRSMEQILRENVGNVNIPIVMNAPMGHGDLNYPFPVGAKAELDATTGQPTLKLLESPFLL